MRFNIFDATFLATRNNRICHILNRLINNCHIHYRVKVPKSLKLEHHGTGVVIGKGVKLGENVQIFHNVTIGTSKVGEIKYPTIGNNVVIYPGSMLMGDIHIGDNSAIMPGTFLNKSVPKNSLVANEKKIIVGYNHPPKK